MPKKDERPVDELAYRFLINKYTIHGIINKFGPIIACRAVTQMAQTIRMCDPENQKARQWLDPNHPRFKGTKYRMALLKEEI